jgi:hypothetical protein
MEAKLALAEKRRLEQEAKKKRTRCQNQIEQCHCSEDATGRGSQAEGMGRAPA